MTRTSSPDSEVAIAERLKRAAWGLGFTQVGICPAVTPTGVTHLAEWLAAGFAGEMRYLENRQTAYEHPSHVLEGAKSLVMLATNYSADSPPAPQAGQGRVARYAEGNDYHDILWQRLNELADWVREALPSSNVRGVVDTAPLLEREFAQLAGLGWVGKNSMLLNRELGSYFFLSALLLDRELPYDVPYADDFCGTCMACLDACPTGAFPAPYVLDSRRCISYLTIELRTPIAPELRSQMGDWLFGCDICQEVCPWNQHAACTIDDEFRQGTTGSLVDLAALFELGDGEFRQRFRSTPLWRPKRRGLLRNAAIVLANQRADGSLAALQKGLNDPEPLVRGACAWALGQFQSATARAALQERAFVECDPTVKVEIESALALSEH